MRPTDSPRQNFETFCEFHDAHTQATHAILRAGMADKHTLAKAELTDEFMGLSDDCIAYYEWLLGAIKQTKDNLQPKITWS
ncbi:hypothetical protein LU293_01675 [Moraxella nasovis]|uniref:hypothetical protein n=1 Tax=Moraxella nasovis TaxID=2904121 RepID=UPI001F606E8A|nr:hypothetical protein [Moraxella nasovis]UNU73647.1 hypothetical protein LU293_01675 [Moraxella nasovis]